MRTFDEPQRIAIQHEVFDDAEDIEESRWVEQRDTMQADRIDIGSSVVLFENSETDDVLAVSAENFISAWSAGVDAD